MRSTSSTSARRSFSLPLRRGFTISTLHERDLDQASFVIEITEKESTPDYHRLESLVRHYAQQTSGSLSTTSAPALRAW
jgi:EAL domain-containing protein (putative c-di-GMP-specific phosphodiesterase class I)